MICHHHMEACYLTLAEHACCAQRGTHRYMAPEVVQAKRKRNVNILGLPPNDIVRRIADMFPVGVIMYEMFFGR